MHNLPSGWCGVAALIFLRHLITQLSPPTFPLLSHYTINTLSSTRCVCHGGTRDTILDTDVSTAPPHGINDTIATTVAFELQLGSETPGENPLREDPPQCSVTWQTSEHFSCPLTPAFIEQCCLPDLRQYTQWNSLDFTNYDSYLTHTFTCLPFTHTHYSQLGLWDAFESLLQQHLTLDVQHSLLDILQQATFQCYCPFTAKLYSPTVIHNFLGIVHDVFPSVTPGYDLYVLLLRPSCPSADYCNHTGKAYPTTGVIMVLSPEIFTRQFRIHPSSSLAILHCTILSLRNLLWTSITYPPQSSIAFTHQPARSNNVIDLFAGIGTWTLASKYLCDHQIICSVDNNLSALQTHSKTFSVNIIPLNDTFLQSPTNHCFYITTSRTSNFFLSFLPLRLHFYAHHHRAPPGPTQVPLWALIDRTVCLFSTAFFTPTIYRFL